MLGQASGQELDEVVVALLARLIVSNVSVATAVKNDILLRSSFELVELELSI